MAKDGKTVWVIDTYAGMGNYTRKYRKSRNYLRNRLELTAWSVHDNRHLPVIRISQMIYQNTSIIIIIVIPFEYPRLE